MEGCPQLILANRTLEKLTPMREELTRLTQSEKLEGPRDRIEILSLDDPILEEAIGASELIINTTSVGLISSDPAPPSTLGGTSSSGLRHHLQPLKNPPPSRRRGSGSQDRQRTLPPPSSRGAFLGTLDQSGRAS